MLRQRIKIDYFHLATIRSSFAPSVLPTSARLKSESAFFNNALQSYSSRSWEFEVASMVMSESLFMLVAFTRAGTNHDSSRAWHVPIPPLRTEGQCARRLKASLALEDASTCRQSRDQRPENLNTVFV